MEYIDMKAEVETGGREEGDKQGGEGRWREENRGRGDK